MQKLLVLVFILAVFALGWVCSAMFAIASAGDTQVQSPFGNAQAILATPSDRVSEDKIHVFSDKIVLDIENASWSTFTPTHSMEPFISEKANGLELKPRTPNELKVGDVISYKSEYASGIIIHRITSIGFDEKGWYCVVKGDNNDKEDPGKIRFEHINGVLIGVIY